MQHPCPGVRVTGPHHPRELLHAIGTRHVNLLVGKGRTAGRERAACLEDELRLAPGQPHHRAA